MKSVKSVKSVLILVGLLVCAACAPTTSAPEATFNSRFASRIPDSRNSGDFVFYVVDETGFIDRPYVELGTLTVQGDTTTAELASVLMAEARAIGADGGLLSAANQTNLPWRYRYTRYRTERDLTNDYPVSERETFQGTRYVAQRGNPDLVRDFGFLAPYVQESNTNRQLEVRLIVYLEE
jgi:hypothetical protein